MPFRKEVYNVRGNNPLLFGFEIPTNNSHLLYGQISRDGSNIWGAILEKAWAKVKGNYLNAEGGFIANGLRALTGAPVFTYGGWFINDQFTLNLLFEAL